MDPATIRTVLCRAVGVAGLAAALLSAPVSTSSSPQRPTLSPEEKRGQDWERWADRVPVSGGVRVGVMALRSQAIKSVERVTIHLPATSAPWLCVEISSRDGRYSGRLRYDIRSAPPGVVDVQVPTAHAAELRAYAPETLAILASISENCANAPTAFVVAAWEPPEAGATTVVFLNSRVPTTIVNTSGNETASCNRLQGVTTAFNLRCELPAGWLSGELDLVIQMRRGRSFSRIALPLRLD